MSKREFTTQVDQGTHEELLGRCETCRRIFAHYGPAQQENFRAGVQRVATS